MNGNGNLIILTGKSGAGKDSVLKELEKSDINTKAFISATTRPMREGEQDGVDYYFLTKDEFLQKAEAGEFIEYRSYNTKVNGEDDVWYYGSPKIELDKTNDYALVLDMQGAKDFVDHFGKENCFVVYINVSDDEREERAYLRGSFDKTEWDRRVKDDNIKFSDDIVNSIANFQTYNDCDVEDTAIDILYAFDEYCNHIDKNNPKDLIVVNETSYNDYYNNPPEEKYNVYERQSYLDMIKSIDDEYDNLLNENNTAKVTLTLTDEELHLLSDMGYDVLNLEQSIHNFFSNMIAVQELNSIENNPLPVPDYQSDNDRTIIGFAVEDGVNVAVYKDKENPYHLKSAIIKNEDNTAYIQIKDTDNHFANHIFNHQESQRLNNYLIGNSISYFADNNNLISIDKENDCLSIVANGVTVRDEINSYATAVAFVSEMFPEALQLNQTTLSMQSITTEQDFKEWLQEKIGDMTLGEYTTKIYPSKERNDILTSEMLLNEYYEYARIAGTDKGLSYNNFEDFVLNQIAYNRQDDFRLLEAGIADYVVSEGLKDPTYAPFIKDYTDGSDIGTISEDRLAILKAGGYKGWEVAEDAFLDYDYTFMVQIATPYETHSDMKLIHLSMDVENMKSDIYNNQGNFACVTDNALTYLTHQQGYYLDNLYKEIISPEENLSSPFIQSVAKEINDAQATNTENLGLAVSISGTGKEILTNLNDLIHGYALELNTEAVIGLYETNSGDFIGQGITLEKEAIIPSDMIASMKPIPIQQSFAPLHTSPFKTTEPHKVPNTSFEDMNETRLNLKEAVLDTKYKNVIDLD